MNKKLNTISRTLKFELNDKGLEQIDNMYEIWSKRIEEMQKIDTEGVKPMVRIDNSPISFLREDSVGEHLSKDEVLKNAPNKDEDFIIVNNGGAHEE